MKGLSFTRRYELLLVLLCLFSFLGAGEPSARGFGGELSRTAQTEGAGEGLFEKMVIDKITSIESSLKELTKRVESIEKRLSRVERGITESTPQPLFLPDSGTTAPTLQAPPKKRLKSTVPKEKDIEEGLRVVNVDYHGAEQNTLFKAEIENNTLDVIEDALFKVEVYGEKGDLLGMEQFELKDIKRAWPKKFTLIIYRVDADTIADYTIKRLR